MFPLRDETRRRICLLGFLALGVAPMRPGMTVEIEIEGVGTLVNRYGGAATPGDGQ